MTELEVVFENPMVFGEVLTHKIRIDWVFLRGVRVQWALRRMLRKGVWREEGYEQFLPGHMIRAIHVRLPG